MGQKIKFRYITRSMFERLLSNFNLEDMDPDDQQELYEEALGLFESDLSMRFIVPLRKTDGSDLTKSKENTRLMIQNTLKHRIRQLLGIIESRNVVIETTEKFIDVHLSAYRRGLKVLLDHKVPFDLKLAGFAEGAQVPVQTVGIARANNELSLDPEIGI